MTASTFPLIEDAAGSLLRELKRKLPSMSFSFFAVLPEYENTTRDSVLNVTKLPDESLYEVA
jgi:hypothetical protein